MSKLANVTFLLRKWEDSRDQINHLRKKVFMDEFGLPINFLRHRDDSDRFHVVAYDDRTTQPVGTGCIHNDGHIGRVAILDSWRDDVNIGQMIISYLMHIARARRKEKVWLNAPADCFDYFVKQDFYPIGEPFEFCGVTMQKLECYLVLPPTRAAPH